MYKVEHLKPVTLTEYGDRLLEYPNTDTESFVKQTPPDDKVLHMCIGVHETCNGWVDIHKTSRLYSAIKCRSCGLRVVVPSSKNTYGKLRKWLKDGC